MSECLSVSQAGSNSTVSRSSLGRKVSKGDKVLPVVIPERLKSTHDDEYLHFKLFSNVPEVRVPFWMVNKEELNILYCSSEF